MSNLSPTEFAARERQKRSPQALAARAAAYEARGAADRAAAAERRAEARSVQAARDADPVQRALAERVQRDADRRYREHLIATGALIANLENAPTEPRD